MLARKTCSQARALKPGTYGNVMVNSLV